MIAQACAGCNRSDNAGTTFPTDPGGVSRPELEPTRPARDGAAGGGAFLGSGTATPHTPHTQTRKPFKALPRIPFRALTVTALSIEVSFRNSNPNPRSTNLGLNISLQLLLERGSLLAKMGQHRRQPSTVNINKNTDWLNHPAAWAWYIGMVAVAWLTLAALLDDFGLAWTYVHLLHGVITYYLLHWNKGTSFIEEDQGKYELLTFWEQVDSGVYATRNRKLLTAMPLLLFILATHGTDFRRQPLGLNLLVVMVLLIAKLPAWHKVRFFGINKY